MIDSRDALKVRKAVIGNLAQADFPQDQIFCLNQ